MTELNCAIFEFFKHFLTFVQMQLTLYKTFTIRFLLLYDLKTLINSVYEDRSLLFFFVFLFFFFFFVVVFVVVVFYCALSRSISDHYFRSCGITGNCNNYY